MIKSFSFICLGPIELFLSLFIGEKGGGVDHFSTLRIETAAKNSLAGIFYPVVLARY